MLLWCIFNLFFNIILISTRIGFNLQGVTRLVAQLAPARQIDSVVPVHVARQGGHAIADAAQTILARQGQCPGPAPASSPLPSLSFPHSTPTRARPGRRRRPPPPPRFPQKSDFFRGKSTGNRSPPFLEDIAPNISSFNRVH